MDIDLYDGLFFFFLAGRRRTGEESRNSRSNLPVHTNRGSYIYSIGANNTNRNSRELSPVSPPSYLACTQYPATHLDAERQFATPPPSYDEAIQQDITESRSNDLSIINSLPDLVTNRNETTFRENRSDFDRAPSEEPPSYSEVLEFRNTNERF